MAKQQERKVEKSKSELLFDVIAGDGKREVRFVGLSFADAVIKTRELKSEYTFIHMIETEQ